MGPAGTLKITCNLCKIGMQYAIATKSRAIVATAFYSPDGPDMPPF